MVDFTSYVEKMHLIAGYSRIKLQFIISNDNVLYDFLYNRYPVVLQICRDTKSEKCCGHKIVISRSWQETFDWEIVKIARYILKAQAVIYKKTEKFCIE